MRIIKILLFLLITALPVFAQQQEAGIVLSVSGDVQIEGTGIGAPTPAAIKTIIYQDDVIITGADGRAQILFRDDTIMSLSPDTELALMDFDFSNTGSSFAANIVKGIARVVTGEIVKRNPESFSISTPHATISIRGTTVTAIVRPSGTSAIVNDATLGRAVIMTSLTNEVISTDQTGMLLHTDSNGASSLREATSEEMRLSQLVSPSLSVGSEQQGADARNELDNKLRDNNDMIDNLPPIDYTASYSQSFNIANSTITGPLDDSFGEISFNVDMSTGEVNDFLVQMYLKSVAPGNVGGLDIRQNGVIYLDANGAFHANSNSGAVSMIKGPSQSGLAATSDNADIYGRILNDASSEVNLVIKDTTDATLSDISVTLPCSGYCERQDFPE